jgi:hypothetical protein
MKEIRRLYEFFELNLQHTTYDLRIRSEMHSESRV